MAVKRIDRLINTKFISLTNTHLSSLSCTCLISSGFVKQLIAHGGETNLQTQLNICF